MNAKMYMKNNKRHKTRKHQDQTRRLARNNLKINEEQKSQVKNFKEKYETCN